MILEGEPGEFLIASRRLTGAPRCSCYRFALARSRAPSHPPTQPPPGREGTALLPLWTVGEESPHFGIEIAAVFL